MAGSDPGEYQKGEAYAPVLGVTVRSLRAAFPFLIVGRTIWVPTSLSNHFNGPDSKSETQAGAARDLLLLGLFISPAMLFCAACFDRAVSSDGRKSSGGKKKFNITSKTSIKIIHLGPVQEYPVPFFRVWFWFKTDTMPSSEPKRSHVSVPEERAGLHCSGLCYVQPSCEFPLLGLTKGRVECQRARLLPLINLITLRGRTPRPTSGLHAPTPWLD